MADLFEFKDGDALVRRYLNSTERNAIPLWQVNTTYQFEFHRKHDTGNPIYIRRIGNAATKLLPKFDTLNKTAASYHGTIEGRPAGVVCLDTLANGADLTANLKSAAKTEICNLIAQSWDGLSLLAERFWGAILLPAVVIAVPVVVVAPADRACITPLCTGRVRIVASGKAPCSVCYTFQ